MKKDLILIIDDNQSLLRSVKQYLEDKNFTVITATSVLQGFKILNKELPAVIILDIMLPKINGFQFLQSIRNNPKFSYIPIIILTGKSLKADRIQGYKLGCNAYLSKPFDMEELSSIIQNLITYYINYVGRFQIEQKLHENSSDYNNHFTPNITGINFKIQNLIELTPKEQHTLNLIALGYMNKEIAKKLHVSIRYIERYVTRLLNRFGVQSRTELVRIAVDYLFIIE